MPQKHTHTKVVLYKRDDGTLCEKKYNSNGEAKYYKYTISKVPNLKPKSKTTAQRGGGFWGFFEGEKECIENKKGKWITDALGPRCQLPK